MNPSKTSKLAIVCKTAATVKYSSHNVVKMAQVMSNRLAQILSLKSLGAQTRITKKGSARSKPLSSSGLDKYIGIKQEQRMPNTMKYSPMRNMFFSFFSIAFGKVSHNYQPIFFLVRYLIICNSKISI